MPSSQASKTAHLSPIGFELRINPIELSSMNAPIFWTCLYLWKKGDSEAWLLLLFLVRSRVYLRNNQQFGIFALMQRQKTGQMHPILSEKDKTHRSFPWWVIKQEKKNVYNRFSTTLTLNPCGCDLPVIEVMAVVMVIAAEWHWEDSQSWISWGYSTLVLGISMWLQPPCSPQTTRWLQW